MVVLPLVLAWSFAIGSPARADRVTGERGDVVEGHVLSVDEESVVVETTEGRIRLRRSAVQAIEFGEWSQEAPPLRVEIRNVRSDDAVDVYLHDELVIERAREGGEWVDLTDRLKNGNNPIRLRIHNARAGWAYHLNVRINGVPSTLRCGTPLRPDQACRCCGKTGRELGEIDDLPVIWLYVDRELGFAEIVP